MRIHETEGVLMTQERETELTEDAPLTEPALQLFTLLAALFGLEEAAGEKRAAAEEAG